MGGHTPGPLRVVVARDDQSLSVHGADCLIYQVIRNPDVRSETWERQKADAYLFASAPTLLSIVRRLAEQRDFETTAFPFELRDEARKVVGELDRP